MAKILLGPTVIGIRGTVAGITFSQNRAGPYARGWHTPPNPKSATQLAARSTLATWAATWRTLTAAQQTTWDVYAAAAPQVLTDSLGQPYYASGFNWWITTQINLEHIGAVSILTAPVLARQVIPLTPTLEFRTTASAQATRWRINALDPNLALNHTAWSVVVNSLGLNIEPAVLYYTFTGIPNVGRYVNITTPLAAKFGTFVVGQRLFSYIYSISAEGQASPIFHLADDCAA
jgi:hypothetical protein